MSNFAQVSDQISPARVVPLNRRHRDGVEHFWGVEVDGDVKAQFDTAERAGEVLDETLKDIGGVQ